MCNPKAANSMVFLILTCFLLSGCRQSANETSNDAAKPSNHESPIQLEPRADGTVASPGSVQQKWELTRDGLKHWKVTNFGGEGEVEAAAGEIILPMGYPMTGITWNGESLPTVNYELTWQAKKTDGDDFFCGLTFPVGDSFCTLILGGWGGNLVGLSCIDGDDAANNGTKQFHQFERERWYNVGIFVDENGIEVQLDGKVIIDQPRGEYKFSVRNETLPSRPLGCCNYQTSSVIRNMVLKKF